MSEELEEEDNDQFEWDKVAEGFEEIDYVEERAPDTGTLKKWYSAFWIFWITSFLIVEGLAVKNPQKGDTLSEHVWYVIDKVQNMGPWGKFVRILITFGIFALFFWLFFHFSFGWW